MSDSNGFVRIIFRDSIESIRVTPQRRNMSLAQLADDLRVQLNGVVGSARDELYTLKSINEIAHVQPSLIAAVVPEMPTT